MTQALVEELEQALNTTLRSGTIEWAANLRICDMLSANPPLSPIAIQRLDHFLRKESPVPVLLALSLLEMVVKNCGFSVCRYVDDDFAEALVSLIKKRESWRYGIGRNLFKSGMGSYLPSGVGIGDDERKFWLQASNKVLEILQLCYDAFLLQEAQLRPVFAAYKKLRQEGHKFPRGEQGASAGLCLVRGAEESPAFLAGACPGTSSTRSPSSAGGGGITPSNTSRGPTAPTSPDLPASVEEPSAPPEVAAAAAATAPSLIDLEEPRADTSAAATVSGGLFGGLVLHQDDTMFPAAAAALAPSTPAVAAAVPEAAPRSRPTSGVEAAVEAAGGVLREFEELCDPAAASAELAERLRSARSQVLRLIEESPEEGLSEAMFDALLKVFGVLNEVCDSLPAGPPRSAAGSAADTGAGAFRGPTAHGADGEILPPPPEEALPDREAQELYDLILARYLQERENAAAASSVANTDEDEALARRLAMEEEGGFGGGGGGFGRASGGYPGGFGGGGDLFAAADELVRCGQCGCENQLPLQGRSSAGRMFCCYGCGRTQGVPSRPGRPQLSAQEQLRARAMEVVPTRNAPPSRVMCAAGEGPELLIGGGGGGGEAKEEEPEATGGSAGTVAAVRKAAAYAQIGSVHLSAGLLGGEGVGGGEVLLGGAPSGKTKSMTSWAKSVGAAAAAAGAAMGAAGAAVGAAGGSSSSSAPRRLGDGVPQCEYAAFGGDDAGASLMGDAALPRNAPSKSMLSWGSKKKGGDDIEESLLERVRVSPQWELIRPAGGRPYWYDSETQVSQWQPPEMVSQGGY